MPRKLATKKGAGGHAGYVAPDGTVRRSQLITTYGPGALVDLVHDAVLISGLEFWRNSGQAWTFVEEPRLRDQLASKLAKAGRVLRREGAFRMPPAGDDQAPAWGRGLDALEFPEWFVCQNASCRALVRARSLERKRDRYVHDCLRSGVECVPVRFVSACSRGHIDEFPWVWFVHTGQAAGEACRAPSLRFEEGATGDFASVRISCVACGSSRRLIDAKVEGNNPHCRGRRPWLGPEGDEERCTEPQRLLVRTASNAYFSQVESALSIPERGAELHDKVQSAWDILKSATRETLSAFRQIEHIGRLLTGHADTDVLAVVESLKRGEQPPRAPLRTAEYRELLAAPLEEPGDLPPPGATFFARRAETLLPAGIESVVLAHKLREVRVQVGFTRIDAVTPDLQGEFDIGVRTAPVSLHSDWLPAVEIRGEGVFIALAEDAVREWEARPAVRARGRELLTAFDAHFGDDEGGPEFPGARFYLLHSLSHLLITALSLECGYSASAIRERIYCAPAHDETPMAGILLSTGSPGTEGTLGGLVEQGRVLGDHVRRALRLGSLCSNDPVCGLHRPSTDYADRQLDGAACHGCLYVAECSCEWFNRFLDRALVTPILGQVPELAFFGRRL